MAWESPLFHLTGLVCGATSLADRQFHFVKLDGSGAVVLCAAATDRPIGVLQNAPGPGEEAQVLALGISKVVADAALSPGALIGTSADGQAAAKTPGTDTTHYVAGYVLRGTTAAGGLATAVIDCMAPHRAA
jgi:hypothetical protein